MVRVGKIKVERQNLTRGVLMDLQLCQAACGKPGVIRCTDDLMPYVCHECYFLGDWYDIPGFMPRILAVWGVDANNYVNIDILTSIAVGSLDGGV